MLCIFSPIQAKCIDHYTKCRVANADDGITAKTIDPRLEAIVNRMFQRCFDDRQYKQAVGIALETRRIDIFENAILKSVRWDEHCSFIYWVFFHSVSLDFTILLLFHSYIAPRCSNMRRL